MRHRRFGTVRQPGRRATRSSHRHRWRRPRRRPHGRRGTACRAGNGRFGHAGRRHTLVRTSAFTPRSAKSRRNGDDTRPNLAPSRSWRRSPGREDGGKTQQYQRERNRTPPVLPEGAKTVVGLTPDPEDAGEQEDGPHNMANSTHSVRLALRRHSHELHQIPSAEKQTVQAGGQTRDYGLERSREPMD